MSGQRDRRHDRGSFRRQQPLDKTRSETQPSQDFEPMPLHFQSGNDFSLDNQYCEQHKTTKGVRPSLITPSPNGNMTAPYPSPWPSYSPCAPPKPATPDRLGILVDVRPVGMNMTNGYSHQLGISLGWEHAPQQLESSNAFQNTAMGHSVYSNMEAAALQFHNRSYLAQDSPQVATDQYDVMDAYYYHQHLKPFCELPSACNDNLHTAKQLQYLEKVREGRIERDLNSPVHYMSTSATLGDLTVLRTAESIEEAAPYESLATLVLTSEPDELPAETLTDQGPIQQPRPVTGLKHTFEIAPNGGLSKNKSTETRKEAVSNFMSWEDGSVTSQVKIVPDAELCEAQRLVDNLAAVIPPHVRNVGAAVQEKLDELEEYLGPGVFQPFKPSKRVLQNMGFMEAGRSQAAPHNYGCSQNYLGDVTIANNRSAEVPANENCAVWMLGLPAHINHTELLGAIRNVGQVYATVINPPTGQHQTSAAKIVFFERYQAEKLMALILDGRNFQVMGRHIRDIRWNKIKSGRYPNPSHSRAIRITGPRELMDFGFFELFFKTRFTYELEARQVVDCVATGMVSHEWRFGSLRCQAASAKTAIERELKGVYDVEWAIDPCA